ncbi:fimbria/pilus periplasmic chaperone [Stenotrophomonas sp. NA06056]|uniref:fimbrial biogenesis chaperone n=1 Tax=Stenotrophomonas sp. NA06056 TaxID=2742129 RepID=UPI00158B32C5|nr:fimbria/pilus periplasmic chaperone [Stenotrophomonas sp. NA06056]QKW56699.1 fimbria/pilus periplasmic chaperone [Stenotrophomonas sp. NA06056]
MLSFNRMLCAGVLAIGTLFAQAADASVVIGGTRVVYPAQDKEVTLKFMNEGERAALVQVWLDDGDDQSTPDTARAPFAVAPPVFRLDPKKQQTARIMFTGAALAADRETLYWLNMLEIPPKTGGNGANILQFAFRTRIKVFYRPPNLTGEPVLAHQKLRWSLQSGPKGLLLRADNPTPYYVNFASVGLLAAGKELGSQGGGMVAPFAQAEFLLDGVSGRPPGELKGAVTVINDFGALVPTQVALQP